MNSKKIVVWGVVVAVVGLLAYMVTAPAGAVKKDIGNDELRKLQAAGARVVDVRTTGEFTLGHLPGAENVPVEDVQAAAAGWDKQQAVVVYCATGARSLNAASLLSAAGFKKVYNLKAGVAGWDGTLDAGAASAPPRIDTGGTPVLYDFSSPT